MADIERLYAEGVAALRKGDRALAREKLTEVVQADQFHEQAWLWLSGAVDSDEERIICLENVLTINPDNEAARKGLIKLGADVPERVTPEQPPPPPAPVADPTPPATSVESTPEPTAEPKVEASVGSQILGEDMHSMISGLPREAVPAQDPDPRADESWRMQLDTSGPIVGDATYLPKDEPAPTRTLSDLTAVWSDMLIFNTFGGFQDEIQYGGFGHVMVNIVVASLLQIVSAVLLFLLLTVLPSANYQPPLLRSISETLTAATSVDVADMVDTEVSGFGDLGFLLDMADVDVNQQLAAGGDEVTQFSLALAAILGTVFIIYAILSIPINFVTQMYESLLTNTVARWLRGKGDAVETMHALTIAFVVAQIVQLPIVLVIPFVSIWVALALWALVALYQFALTAVSVGAVHKFGIFLSIGVLILSNALGNFIAGLASFVLSILFAASG